MLVIYLGCCVFFGCVAAWFVCCFEVDVCVNVSKRFLIVLGVVYVIIFATIIICLVVIVCYYLLSLLIRGLIALVYFLCVTLGFLVACLTMFVQSWLFVALMLMLVFIVLVVSVRM